MDDIRWKQRFQNFEKAYKKLKKAVDSYKQNPEDDLIQMALIQAFEFNFELSWNLVKDFLEYEGIIVKFPRDTIKEGYQANIIVNGEIWIEMIEDRNLTSHTYNEEQAKKIIDKVINTYLSEFEKLCSYFKERL
ncbi:MAG: hypothetical protein A2Y25_02250 [Candidatus Melainabacteria bacterium GWF2_37_15]|nr:MAG: hypothetical protein A2Y25_02250 [Candidatus Melainabacteria bacterium GWF2_37_15]